MSKFIKRAPKKVGAAPGTLVHVGTRSFGDVKIRITDYYKDYYEDKYIDSIYECMKDKESNSIRWISVDGIHKVDMVEKIGEMFNLHPLMLEDILNTRQRAKIDDYGDQIYIVLKMLEYDEDAKELKAQQISIILIENCVISFMENENHIFDNVRERIKNVKSSIRRLEADYLIYSLIDAVVDSYFVILEKIGDITDSVEEELMKNPDRQILQRIYRIKRELMFLRNSIWPLREVVGTLVRCEFPLLNEGTGIFLRDVYDHIVLTIDTVETYQDIMTNMLDTYLSSVSNKTNDVMKVLTIFSTIFIPLTFLAGIYGMNFRNIPELSWNYGYVLFWVVSIIIIIIMLLFFRRKKWL